MTHAHANNRRTFLKTAATTSAGLWLASLPAAARGNQPPPPSPAGKKEEPAEDISPVEDLMREHGLLERVLLVYDEAQRRIDAKADLPPEPPLKAADLIRRFVEDYHERLEEQHLFPRFRKANKLADLADVLLQQHEAGRRLTDEIRQRATAAALKNPDESRKLAESLRTFNRMYRPHAAREDTVLFPAFHTLVTPEEYDKLGDEFEDQEHALFGVDGFEKMVGEVAAIEKSLGIYELAQFTPRA